MQKSFIHIKRRDIIHTAIFDIKRDTSISKPIDKMDMVLHTEYTWAGNKTSGEPEVGFETLYPALVEIFGIVALGYISGR